MTQNYQQAEYYLKWYKPKGGEEKIGIEYEGNSVYLHIIRIGAGICKLSEDIPICMKFVKVNL